MIPIRDNNPALHLPIATYVLIGMNVVVWAVVQGFGAAEPMARSLCQYALIPGEVLSTLTSTPTIAVGDGWFCQLGGPRSLHTVMTSMFMHGSWLHIAGNLLFLWVFGDNVEDVMGPGRFAVFYLLCGCAAALAQILHDPDSLVPMVGASGAIGGVMGAYAILFPRARVDLLIFLVVFITVISVPAIFMLLYWFGLQLVSGLTAQSGAGGGVAFWAHVGGFVAGLVLAYPCRHPHRVRQHLRQRKAQRMGR